MTTLQVKSELHKIIDSIDDISILKAIRLLLQKDLTKEEIDFWDTLPNDIKKSIEQGIYQADAGELVSHESVMNEVKEKYNIK